MELIIIALFVLIGLSFFVAAIVDGNIEYRTAQYRADLRHWDAESDSSSSYDY